MLPGHETVDCGTMKLRSFKHERVYFGGGGGGTTQQVIQQTSPAAAPTPEPPTRGDAAKNITPWGVARMNRKMGRAGTQLTRPGSMEDSIKSLLGQ